MNVQAILADPKNAELIEDKSVAIALKEACEVGDKYANLLKAGNYVMRLPYPLSKDCIKILFDGNGFENFNGFIRTEEYLSWFLANHKKLRDDAVQREKEHFESLSPYLKDFYSRFK